MGYYGSCEHVAFNYADQTVWGTASETGFVCAQELTGEQPYSPQPKVQRRQDGSGQLFPNEDYMFLGRPALDKTFRFYATVITVRDFLYMLTQASETYGAGMYTFTPPLAPEATVMATLITKSSTRASNDFFVGDSCIMRSMTFNLGPMAPGDASGGFIELDTQWVGRCGTRSAAATYAVASTDVGAPYSVGDMKVEIGANTGALTDRTADFIGGSITLSNGGHLKPGAASADGYAGGALMGEWAVNGSITAYDTGQAASLANSLFLSLATPTYYMLRVTLGTGGSYELTMDIPISVRGEPRKADQNGLRAYTFEWEAVYTSTALCVHQYKLETAVQSPFDGI